MVPSSRVVPRGMIAAVGRERLAVDTFLHSRVGVSCALIDALLALWSRLYAFGVVE